jgi:hypothetical protein
MLEVLFLKLLHVGFLTQDVVGPFSCVEIYTLVVVCNCIEMKFPIVTCIYLSAIYNMLIS